MAQPEEEKWPRIRARLRAKIGSEMFELWLPRLQFEYIHNKTFACSLPTESLVQWACNHYTEDLLHAAQVELKEEQLERAVFLHRKLEQPIVPPQEKKKAEDEEDPDPIIGAPYRVMPIATESGIDSLIVTQAEAAHRTSPASQEQPGAAEVPSRPFSSAKGDRFTMKAIAEVLCEYFNLAFEDMIDSRLHDAVRKRDITILLIRTLTRETVEEIAKFFGGRSSPGVHNALSKLKALKQEDTEVASRIQQAEAYVRSRLQQTA